MQDISIFIAEDHMMTRMGLKMLLEGTTQFKVVGEAEDGEAAVKSILTLKPNVVMMDLGLPKINGIEATSQIKSALPETKILIFTSADDDESIFAALKAGADGYCLKNISGEALNVAIQSVMAGAAWLDPKIANKVLRAQKSEVKDESSKALSTSKIKLLSMLEAGKSVDEISRELNVDESLVKDLLNELLHQLKGTVGDQQQATQKAAIADQNFKLTEGDVIAQHYKIESLLGAGGMGCVYKAKHTFIDRTVAIKTLHSHVAKSEGTLARFKAEAESSAAAVHPNLVTIYDFGLLPNSVPYIVMEYIEGISLQDLLDRHQTIDEQTAKEIFMQVCDALGAVHEKGIVHRDLKPANVMLLDRDGKHFVKVVDFGIAKILDSEKHNLTQTGECLGTPYYMSPEQCMGSGRAKIDHRSDLYSLGCMMYEALTGEPIFVGSTFLEIVMGHVRETPSMEPLKTQKISSGLIDTISKLTMKGADERPANAGAVKHMLSTVKKGIFS